MANYKAQVIDKQEQARRNYEADPQNEDRKKELKDAYDRTTRALEQKDAGAGRGSARPPMSRKWTE